MTLKDRIRASLVGHLRIVIGRNTSYRTSLSLGLQTIFQLPESLWYTLGDGVKAVFFGICDIVVGLVLWTLARSAIVICSLFGFVRALKADEEDHTGRVERSDDITPDKDDGAAAA